MRWPWQREVETRSDFTTLYTGAVAARADGTTPRARATAALETCAGLIGRSFAAATVEGPDQLTAPLTPGFMAMVGRALVRDGEMVAVIEVRNGRAVLLPGSYHDVWGSHDPASWLYRVTLNGPTSIATQEWLPHDGVVHFMHQRDPSYPWRGLAPLDSATLAGQLSASTVEALADEAGTTRAYLLPTPKPGDDPSMTALRADLRTSKGGLHLVESMAAEWQGGDGRTAPRRDWETKRIGADPPQALVMLAERATAEVYAACGVPPQLVEPQGDGTAAREAYRRFLHATVAPLGRLIEAELSEKLESDIRVNFDSLFAADLAGRARAFQSMVGAGMDPAKAAGLAGLMGEA